MFLFCWDVTLSSGVSSYAVLQSLFSKEVVLSILLGYRFQSYSSRDALKYTSVIVLYTPATLKLWLGALRKHESCCSWGEEPQDRLLMRADDIALCGIYLGGRTGTNFRLLVVDSLQYQDACDFFVRLFYV